MSTEKDRTGEEIVDNPGEIAFAWERLPRGKTQVQARHCEQLFHCASFQLSDSKLRAKYVKEVIARAREQFGVEPDPRAIEAALLAIIETIASQPAEDTVAAPVEYQVVEDQDDPDRNGVYVGTANGPVQLANFIAYIDRDITILDWPQTRRRFEGRVILHGVVSEFVIDSEDYGIGPMLVRAIFKFAGPKAKILVKPEVLCRAISSISSPERRVVSRNFGWNEAGDAYLTPSVRIDADGIHPIGADDTGRVDLSDEQCAQHLDLAVPDPVKLPGLQRHVVKDLLCLHDRQVTYALLAAAALAALYRFVSGINSPALWLVGLTGGGKSFLAKLFMNFFGNFPIEIGSAVGSWSSTAMALQRQGYFFKDALFLIDDYKTDVARHKEAVFLVQNYADGSARGRLNRDSTSKASHEIRGTLIATGEAVPEHTSSSIARTVIIPVPSRTKNTVRRGRCIAQRRNYPALMASFVHHLIVQDRPRRFVERVQKLQETYYQTIAGCQNDLRIAANVALLGAAFEEFAAFLAPEWPDHKKATRRFVETDLPAIRDAMVSAARNQQPSEVFLATLRELIGNCRVKILVWAPGTDTDSAVEHRPQIGKVHRRLREATVFAISTRLAMEAVQDSLRRQGSPPLAATERTIVDQLAADGKLYDQFCRPIDPQARGDRTHDAALGGSTRKVFYLLSTEIV